MKKMLSLLLAVILAVGIMPTTASAVEDTIALRDLFSRLSRILLRKSETLMETLWKHWMSMLKSKDFHPPVAWVGALHTR